LFCIIVPGIEGMRVRGEGEGALSSLTRVRLIAVPLIRFAQGRMEPGISMERKPPAMPIPSASWIFGRMRMIPRQKNAVITSGVSRRPSGEINYCRSVPAASRTAMSAISREFTGTTLQEDQRIFFPGSVPGMTE
jgi:hypothetical protein